MYTTTCNVGLIPPQPWHPPPNHTPCVPSPRRAFASDSPRFAVFTSGAIIAPVLPGQPNQSLIDGLACLQALASSSAPLGSREVARLIGHEPTRTNRLLKTLAHLGLVEQDADRKYRPGPAMHVLSAQALYGSGLIRRAVPALQALHRFGYVVALGVLWQRHVAYLYHAEPDMAPAEAIGRVGLYPATQSGIGIALLARLPDSAVRDLFAGHEIPGYPSYSLLRAEMRVVRETGYALVNIPSSTSRTLAVAVGEPAFAAVALSGKIREKQIPQLITILKQTADQISKEPHHE
jgi:DNA-binding IclR family transcriptional regulator